MKTKQLMIIIAIVLIFVNLPFWSFILQREYDYSNINGSFKLQEDGKTGIEFRNIMLNYGRYLCQHPEMDRGDNNLYRTFTIQPWRFWEWREMIFHSERFSLPYLEVKK